LRNAALTLLVVLLLTASPAGLCSGSAGGLIQRDSAPDLFLLYTGDVIGYLGPCG
jgi:hypothetical protein